MSDRDMSASADVPLPEPILVTGASGFVGRHLVRHLAVRLGQRPHCAGRQELDEELGSLSAGFVPLDLADPESILAAFRRFRPRSVFHLAAQGSVAQSWSDPLGTVRVNALGTVALLEAVRREAPEARVLVVGSAEECAGARPGETPMRGDSPLRPITPYGLAKAFGRLAVIQYAESHHLAVLSTRPVNHTGPGQPASYFIPSVCRQVAMMLVGSAPLRLSVGNLAVERDFLDVRDVARGYALALARGTAGACYVFSSGRARPLFDLVEELRSVSGVDFEIASAENLRRGIDAPRLVGDTEETRRDLGWIPEIPFRVTLRDTIDYWSTRL